MLFKQLFQFFGVKAVRLHRNAEKLGIIRTEAVKAANKAWFFANYAVAGVYKRLTCKVNTLLTATYDDYIVVFG